MTTAGYLIHITASKSNFGLTRAVLDIAPNGHQLLGSSDEVGHSDWWIIPADNESSKDLIAEVQGLPSVRRISFVTLSKQIKDSELAQVRALFAEGGYDARSISHQELLLYINDKLERDFRYYMAFDFKKHNKGLVKIQIRPVEEQFNSAQLASGGTKQKEDKENRTVNTHNELVQTAVVKWQGDSIPTPPSPGFTCHFKSLQEWLYYICETNNPEKSISQYRFLFYESPNFNTLSIAGYNFSDEGVNSVSSLDFEPLLHPFLSLHQEEFIHLSTEQVRERIFNQLKEFTTTPEFRDCFLSRSKSITLNMAGEIWCS